MYAVLIVLALVGALFVSGCVLDEITAPRRSYEPRVQIMGDLPTSHLVEVSALRYVPGEGIELDIYVSHGLLQASQAGQADFRLTTHLVAENLAGQTRAISPKVDPFALLKTTLSELGPLELVKTLVPWDGLDDKGNPMTGDTTIEYLVEIVNYRPNPTGDGIFIGGKTGITRLVIPG